VLPSAIAEDKEAKIEAEVASIRKAGIKVEVEILFGKAFVEIIREVLRNGHDLVMKTAHQRGLLHLVDHTAIELLRNCPCPVELVRPTSRRRHSRILACIHPVPGDSEQEAINRKVMELAIWLAERDDAELHVVHAWHAFAEGPLRGHTGVRRRELQKYIASQRTASRHLLDDFLAGFKVELGHGCLHLVKGDPAVVIPRLAEKQRISLVVMGTVARSGIAGMVIGNTAEKVAGKLESSLLAVKPDDFICPIRIEH
jgi:nucleotide-binding universal stress UspA family protein